MRRIFTVGLGLLGASGAFWLGMHFAPARYQLVDNQGLLVRLDQRSGALEVFVVTKDADTGQLLVASPDQARQDRQRREEAFRIAAQAASRQAAELQTRIAPCLKTGKRQLDCEWEDLLRRAQRESAPKR